MQAAIDALLVQTKDFTKPERWVELPGGTATNRTRFDGDAFSQPSTSLSFEDRAKFSVGDGLFKRTWVTVPSSTRSADGLGPLFNARGCQDCHLKDGRGHPPAREDDSAISMFLRLSVPPITPEEKQAIAEARQRVIPEPTYGGQLRDIAIPGHRREGRIVIDYTDVPVTRAALHRRGEQLRFLEASEDVDIRLKQYLGDIAFDSQGATVAATSPVGSVVAFWDGASGAYLRTADASDGCSGSA